MPLTFEYVDSLAECWPTEKTRERAKLWPDPLTWAWILGPRIADFSPDEQRDFVAMAVTHAHKQRIRLWDRPGAIFEAFKVAEQPERLALAGRLAEALDAWDASMLEKAHLAAQAVVQAREDAEAQAARDAEAAAEAERRAAAEAERVELERRAQLTERERAELAAAEVERQRLAELELEPPNPFSPMGAAHPVSQAQLAERTEERTEDE